MADRRYMGLLLIGDHAMSTRSRPPEGFVHTLDLGADITETNTFSGTRIAQAYDLKVERRAWPTGPSTFWSGTTQFSRISSEMVWRRSQRNRSEISGLPTTRPVITGRKGSIS